MPLIHVDEKNACRKRMLQSDILSVRREFCECQHAVKAAVDKARKNWILKVANQVESVMSKGEVYWESMKKLQAVYHGCKPVWVSTAVDENSCMLTNHSDVCARWQHHFLNVLNVPSNFQEDVVNSMMQLSVRDHLDGVPSCRKVQSALGHLKCCKAAGESDILPELLFCGGSIIIDKLVELFELVWEMDVLLGTGVMLSLCLYLRKVTLHCAIIGEGLVC